METAAPMNYNRNESWRVSNKRTQARRPVQGQRNYEWETWGGRDATLGIGFFYRGAYCSRARLFGYCIGCGRNREDYLLCLPGSLPRISGEPSPAPDLRDRLSRSLYRS